MATCIACEAEVETGGLEIGETVTCGECGAEMEVISLRPFEMELVDDTEEDDDADDDDEDDLEEEEDDEEEAAA
jgi:alpha-aminoadipate carrier protein LysW